MNYKLGESHRKANHKNINEAIALVYKLTQSSIIFEYRGCELLWEETPLLKMYKWGRVGKSLRRHLRHCGR